MFFKNPALLVLSLFIALPLEAEAKGVNDQFTYSAACQAEAATFANAKKPTRDEKNLGEDLSTLDNMVKILNDRKEDPDFRLQVLTDAERIRQSMFYSLNKISKLNRARTVKIMADCGLAKIKDGLNLDEKVFEEIVTGGDGVDEGAADDKKAESNPAMIESRNFVAKRELPGSAPASPHTELNAVGVE